MPDSILSAKEVSNEVRSREKAELIMNMTRIKRIILRA